MTGGQTVESGQTPQQIAAPKTVAPAELARCEEAGGLLAGLLLTAG